MKMNWEELIYDFSVQRDHNNDNSSNALMMSSLHRTIETRSDHPYIEPSLSQKIKILYGNNAISTQSFEDVADRVLLGLLPSSENGWEIAIRLISREKGGILHLHENVLEKDLSSFIKDRMLVKLKDYCKKYRKEMIIEVIHVEKVKSYSPHVYHYVFDILLTPLETPNKN
jgi:hypothetical protein